MKTKLGATYKDAITGFSGVCIGTVQYISGCNQSLLAPKGDKDARWIDDQRLVQCGSKVIALDNCKTPGGDLPAPIR
jgi:hypothetical protein